MKSSYLKRNGHERYKFVHKNNGPEAIARRAATLGRLEAQLATGTKPDGNDGFIPLEKKDEERIKKEIVILKQKLSIV